MGLKRLAGLALAVAAFILMSGVASAAPGRGNPDANRGTNRDTNSFGHTHSDRWGYTAGDTDADVRPEQSSVRGQPERGPGGAA